MLFGQAYGARHLWLSTFVFQCLGQPRYTWETREAGCEWISAIIKNLVHSTKELRIIAEQKGIDRRIIHCLNLLSLLKQSANDVQT